MRLFSTAMMALVASSLAAPDSTTPSPTPSTSHKPDIALPAANDNTVVDAFFQCLWPVSDRVVDEILNLQTVDYNKLIDEIHWEILWWGHPDKWVNDFAGIGLNTTMVVECLLETVGKGLFTAGTDFIDEFLKTLKFVDRGSSNTDVPGLK